MRLLELVRRKRQDSDNDNVQTDLKWNQQIEREARKEKETDRPLNATMVDGW